MLVLSGQDAPTQAQIKAAKERSSFLASNLIQQGFKISPFHLQRAEYLKRRPALQTLAKAPPKDKTLYLTFDDGPLPGPTDEVLSILDKEGIKATFFLVGSRVEEAPFLAQEVRDRGHELANHTYYHPNLTWLSAPQVRAELLSTNWTIERHTGVKPLFARAPGCSLSKMVSLEIAGAGLVSTLFTINPSDLSASSPDHLRKLILSQAKPGAIVLLHEYSAATRAMLPGLLKTLKAEGWKFGRLQDSGAAGTVTDGA